MDGFNKIDLIHLHAVEETLRYTEKYGDKTTYSGLIAHLSWYWAGNSETKHQPCGWMLDWIKCLTGKD